MNIYISAFLFLAGLLPAVTGCAASTKVQRMDVDEVKDISGKWNDTDSRLVAEEMIQDCLNDAWLPEAKEARSGKPSVIVGTVRNQSHEHINTDTFVEDLQNALIKSRQVKFVASKGERGEVRDERRDQDTNASEDTRKEHGQETGADFMLSGAINTIQDTEAGKTVMFYQVNLKLVDMKSNEISWNGKKKIKKFIKQAKVSW
ncbi:MAG: penicillin-binding protein activator LpoB [Elusimicrobia bacterium]|nr:penicillin-binding protein activator LpoB [Elusimicrobiota bacterium]